MKEQPLTYPQHFLLKSFLLHILPGALVTIAFVLLKSIPDSIGFPPLLAFLLAILLIDLPVLLGIMFFEGRRQNGKLSLEGVVLYRELYFRGYLMPRISRYKWWTPTISGIFFGLYHSWQPFGFPLRKADPFAARIFNGLLIVIPNFVFALLLIGSNVLIYSEV